MGFKEAEGIIMSNVNERISSHVKHLEAKIKQLQEVINVCDETLSEDINLENEGLQLYSEQAVNWVHRELSEHACWQSKE